MLITGPVIHQSVACDSDLGGNLLSKETYVIFVRALMLRGTDAASATDDDDDDDDRGVRVAGLRGVQPPQLVPVHLLAYLLIVNL